MKRPAGPLTETWADRHPGFYWLVLGTVCLVTLALWALMPALMEAAGRRSGL